MNYKNRIDSTSEDELDVVERSIIRINIIIILSWNFSLTISIDSNYLVIIYIFCNI